MIRQSCLRYWRLALFTPLAYLVICLGVDYWVFAGRVEPGFYRLKEPLFLQLWQNALGLALGLVALIYLLKKIWWIRPAVLEFYKTFTMIRQVLLFRYMCLLILCDLIAFSGMTLFLMQGQFEIFLYFALTAMLGYAAIYPPEIALDRIYQTEKNDENQ